MERFDPATVATSPRPLFELLAEQFPRSSRQTLKRMVEHGRVWIADRQARRLIDPVSPGEAVRVEARGHGNVEKPSLDSLEIVFEDRDLVVINKPAGLLTSTGPREKRPTALAMLRKLYARTERQARIGVVHRLDRDASGLLVFSKTNAAYDSLKRQLFQRDIQRIYCAVVHGVPNPPGGRIESRLVEHADGTVHATRARGKGRRAVTHYEVVRQHERLAELCVRLETGRKHQIRVHLAGRGWPIVGDRVYGRPDGAKRLMLAAVELGFDHPRTGGALRFSVPKPVEIQRLFPDDRALHSVSR